MAAQHGDHAKRPRHTTHHLIAQPPGEAITVLWSINMVCLWRVAAAADQLLSRGAFAVLWSTCVAPNLDGSAGPLALAGECRTGAWLALVLPDGGRRAIRLGTSRIGRHR